MTLRAWGCLGAFGLLLACSGCATLPTRAEIPVGEWSGEGTFFLVKCKPLEEGTVTKFETIEHGVYPTHLKIELELVEGRAALRLEILSERGAVEQLDGERSHLVMHLRPMLAVADNAIMLYHLIDWGYSSNENAPKVDSVSGAPVQAMCMVVRGDLVLRIRYMEHYVDTFRFRGNALYKDGAIYSEEDDGSIHWSEYLKKKRP
ncbi:MAG: hypothetical protein KKB50_14185 [Planctomycetes bacterium]|nr:hypothetical protein [Planctomycetota bacterium]